MTKNIITYDKYGLRHGYCETYWEDGFLDSKAYWIHGLKHGYCEEYWGNGKLWAKGLYIHGKRHGCFEEYWRNGDLRYKEYFYMSVILYQTSNNKLIL